MIKKKTWAEFRETGLLWFINSILHVFGWAIAVEIEDDKITDVYPVRTSFRGFDENTNSNGYKRVTHYLADNIESLLKDTEE